MADISYEAMRMEKLRRNQQVMLSLGLADVATTSRADEEAKRKSRAAAAAERRNVKKRLAEEDEGESRPATRRRSPRLSGESVSSSSAATEKDEEESEEEEAEEQYAFDPSKVLQYSCYDESAAAEASKPQGDNLRPVGSGVADPALKRIYSMSFHAVKPLLACGGHGGRVAVFSSTCAARKPDETLLSFKASRGWISGVRFLDGMDCGIVVTSNDGSVSLWDCTVQHDAVPKQISAETVHGGSGIYDLDVYQSRLITSSKDGSLCLSSVEGNSKVTPVTVVEDAHDGVAKSVMFRPNSQGNIVCSGGNDSAVRVWDLRAASSKPAIDMTSSSGLAVNIVRWNPAIDHVVLSASFATSMELHDTRYPETPTQRLRGHIPLTCQRVSNIYQPIFVNNGTRIVASGGGSKNLTMFDSLNGSVVSSGVVGWEAGSLEAMADGSRIAVSHGMDVSFFDCTV